MHSCLGKTLPLLETQELPLNILQHSWFYMDVIFLLCTLNTLTRAHTHTPIGPLSVVLLFVISVKPNFSSSVTLHIPLKMVLHKFDNRVDKFTPFFTLNDIRKVILIFLKKFLQFCVSLVKLANKSIQQGCVPNFQKTAFIKQTSRTYRAYILAYIQRQN